MSITTDHLLMPISIVTTKDCLKILRSRKFIPFKIVLCQILINSTIKYLTIPSTWIQAEISNATHTLPIIHCNILFKFLISLDKSIFM